MPLQSGPGYRRPMPFDHLKRRDFIALLGGVAAAWPLAARAEPSKKTFRIGFLGVFSLAENENRRIFDAFRTGLRQLGYEEGRNIIIDFLSTQLSSSAQSAQNGLFGGRAVLRQRRR